MLSKIDKHCYEVLLKTFKETDLTYKEMVDISGFSIWSIIKYIKKLESAKKVHVCGYYKDALGRETIKIFRYGNGISCKRNKMSGAEKQKKYKQRKKLNLFNIGLI